VSSDFGKLEVRRHRVSGVACAIAGLATATAASEVPAVWRNWRRFIRFSLFKSEMTAAIAAAAG
jgi:hypothetical protein